MKVNEIIKLLAAGYSKEEIEAFEKAEAPEEAAPVDIPEPEKEAAPVDIPEPEKEEKKDEAVAADQAQPDPVQDQIAKLTAAMERMSGMIISQNINRTVTDGAPGRTVEDMLAEVINPPRKEGMKK